MSSRAWLGAVLVSGAAAAVTAQEPQRPTFRSSLDLVSVAVVVRQPDGRLVTDLEAGDFEILDRGAAQPIVQFERGDDAHARLALLVDTSGSMVVGAKRERSRIATELLAAGMKPSDGATVFSFDARLRRLTPFTRDVETLREAVTRLEPWGVTSLYDAILGTIASVAEESPRTRALLLLTDGIDTASVKTPFDAAQAAAALDIPLYVLSVGKDQMDEKAYSTASAEAASVTLQDLATRTGGLAAEAATVADLSIATRTILSELRHQYVIAIPAGEVRGWHDLTVRVKRGRVQARSRNGYYVS
ncbi:MAG TPA: VWA domain-containing protein [Vicinamibacterales bacterium]|nr:VWA domain-containing protein [Vicinamibacterales bacterium]